jgi:hypothetical protein
MPTSPNGGNQYVLSGNYGEVQINNQVLGEFQNWTLNYSASVTPLPQASTGTAILVPGMITVSLTITKWMGYTNTLTGFGIEPTNTMNDLYLIPPFTSALYDKISGRLVKTALGCLFDSNTMNLAANTAISETLTIMAVDVAGNSGAA